MQHSPQEIKTILDRVVDADGNVLDMAAVLEVVTILERLPITKEALEISLGRLDESKQFLNSHIWPNKPFKDITKKLQHKEKTRLGKTINLLRKKTTNEELAKRAKGLVKKWQKLVINHLETLRNTDSPINGSRVSSPQINGTIRDTEKPASPSVDRAGKSKILEGKKRGVKRKRVSCSSSENSPNVVLKSDDSESFPGTPNSGQEIGLGTQRSSSASLMTSQPSEEKECSTPVSETLQSGEKENLSSLSQESQSVTPQSEDKKHLPSVSQVVDSQSTEYNSLLSVDSGIGSQPSVKNVEEFNSESQTVTNESELNECRPETTDNDPCVSQDSHNVTDARWNSETLTSKIASTSDAHTNLSQEAMLETESPVSPTPKELVLDINVQANGVTGRYGGDGTWYDWTAVMRSSDNVLQILPYVILE